MFKVSEISQIGVVVRDIEQTMDNYYRLLGWGPWKVYTSSPAVLSVSKVRGKDTPFSMEIALYHIGNIQIELIQPLSGPTLYQEFIDTNGEGLQHLACFDTIGDDETLERHQGELAEMGFSVSMNGRVDGTRFFYYDTEPQLGTIYETGLRDPKRVLDEYDPAEKGIEPPEFKVTEISQIGIVVKDLYRSMENYCRILGWGPWDVYPTYTSDILKEPTVGGKEQVYSMKVATNDLDNVQVELIQSMKGPNIYTEHMEAKGEGLHHMACYGQIKNVEILKRHQKELDANGLNISQSGMLHDSAFYYYDTEEMLGGVIYETGGVIANTELGPLPTPEGKYPKI